jgi:excisionase family DNA binding protein
MNTIKAIVKISFDAQEIDFDPLIVIAGYERNGKSTLALEMYQEFYRLKGWELNIKYYTTDLENFIKAIDESPVGGIVVLDEAGDILTSANHWDEFNKKIREAYTIIGGKRLFTILILPDYFVLETYFRKWRTKAVLFVYRRGKVALWVGKQKLAMLNKYGAETKNPFAVNPSGYDTFSNIEDCDFLRQYKKMKTKRINDKLKELRDTLEMGDTVWLKKATKLLQISYPTALKWVIDGKLPAIKTSAGRYKVKMEDIDRLKEVANDK